MKMTTDLRKLRKAARRQIRRDRKRVRFLTMAEAGFHYPKQTKMMVRQLHEHGVDERAAQVWVDREGVHLSVFVNPVKTYPCP